MLAPLRGAPLLSHLLEQISRLTEQGALAGVLVVLPPNALEREALVRRAGAEYVFTPGPGGVAHSIQAGLGALASRHPDASAALIFPGDQPAVSSSVITRLLDRWTQGETPVVRPRYQEEPEVPGHPVVLDRAIWSRADQLSGDTGFVQLFQNHPELVTIIDVPGNNPTINTPADLARWESSTQ